MKEKIKDWFEWHEEEIKFVLGLIICVAITFLFIVFMTIFLIKSATKKDNQLWNNGHCECGGKYEYEQAVGTRYGTNYIYKCTMCDKRIQLNEIR